MRMFIEKLEKENLLKQINEPISVKYQITNYLKNTPQSYLFNNLKETTAPGRIAANLITTRKHLALALDCKENELIKKISHAMNHLIKTKTIKNAPCQEHETTLNSIPIPTYFKTDGGPYITSGVVVSSDPEYGPNLSFHRIMKREDHLVIRVVQRHTWDYYERANRNLKIAICIGVEPEVLIAGAISTEENVNELEIASALKGEPIEVIKCKTSDLLVPANSEIIIEGTITKDFEDEGPFVDITLTPDTIRKQPKVTVHKITTRKNPIFHALLPGGYEHGTIWKTPTEAVIYKEVNKVCKCIDAYLTLGGCSRLHGVVQIIKNHPDDPKKAIDSAFKAHPSMKHVFIVDDDIDIQDPYSVEWAMATRFQAKTDLTIFPDSEGSSLDPSTQKTGKTTKLGFDLTIKGNKPDFKRVF